MKKISIFLAFLVAICTLSSCVDEREPIYQNPTNFQLNTPALANQLFQLTEKGAMTLTWSQPDYGYSAVAKYTVDVAIDPEFKKFEALDGTYTVCSAQITDKSVAEAVCKLMGVTKDNLDDYPDLFDPAPLYFRVNSTLDNIEESKITSNVVTFSKVQCYKAVQAPGFIYLVGKPEGWAGPTAGAAEHYANWRLFEADDAIGSKIYTGVFNINAGDATFRFYTQLTGWDADSYGTQVDDNPIDIALDGDGVYNGSLVKGKGSFNIPDWTGGSMKITVDMSKEGAFKVKFEAGGVDYTGKAFIYLVDAPEGWAGPDEVNKDHYADWKLYDMNGDGNYSMTFNIPVDKFTFRFYTKLSGWDGGDSYGSQEADSPVDISTEWEDGVCMAPAMVGKGAWTDPAWAGGKVKINVNTKDGVVTFTKL